MLKLKLLGLVLLAATFASAWAGTLSVQVITPNPSITEGQDTSVTFRVTNTTGGDLILDYALAIINGPPSLEDNIFFKGVTFPTIIANTDTQDFVYGLTSVPDDPLDPTDDGLNHVTFYLGMSPSAGGVPQILNAQGLGAFFFFNNGPGSTGTLIPGTLTLLQNCYNNPGPLANPCNIGTNLLYTGEIQAQAFPSVAAITVNDLPEPGSAFLLLGGLVLCGVSARKYVPKLRAQE